MAVHLLNRFELYTRIRTLSLEIEIILLSQRASISPAFLFLRFKHNTAHNLTTCGFWAIDGIRLSHIILHIARRERLDACACVCASTRMMVCNVLSWHFDICHFCVRKNTFVFVSNNIHVYFE